MIITEGRDVKKINIPKYISRVDVTDSYKKDTTICHYSENDYDITNFGYLEYLENCWAYHYGAVITPDILWSIISSQIVEIVKEDPEKYRSAFSNSEEKQEISCSGSTGVLPVSDFLKKLKERINVDINLFIPDFSTTTAKSQTCFGMMFMDMVSPYYNYSVYCCGIPYYRIEGDIEEYLKISRNLSEIKKHIDHPHIDKMMLCVNNFAANMNSKEFMDKMFYVENCGSGSQKELFGWITEFFLKIPSLRTINNFSTQIGIVEWKDLPTSTKWKAYAGIFSSKIEDEFLIPDFGIVTTCLGEY